MSASPIVEPAVPRRAADASDLQDAAGTAATTAERVSRRSANADNLQDRVEAYLLEKAAKLFDALRRMQHNSNANELHRLRVSSRRLRVGLRFFAPLFDAAELRQVQRQLRRVTRGLGEIRALDVNRQLVRRLAHDLPPAAGAVRTALEQRLRTDRAARAAELQELIQMLAASRFEQRLRALITRARYLDNARVRNGAAAELNNLRQTLKRRHRQFTRHGGGRFFHKLRIAVKQYRYGLETAEAVFAVPVRDAIRSMENLQDLMGDYHDLEVLLEYLKQQETKLAPGEKSLAVSFGTMVKFLKQEHTRHRETVGEFLDHERLWLKKVKLRRTHE